MHLRHGMFVGIHENTTEVKMHDASLIFHLFLFHFRRMKSAFKRDLAAQITVTRSFPKKPIDPLIRATTNSLQEVRMMAGSARMLQARILSGGAEDTCVRLTNIGFDSKRKSKSLLELVLARPAFRLAAHVQASVLFTSKIP